MSFELGWVDSALLAALTVSLMVGAVRGLVFEVLAIAAWVVAYFAALWLAPWWATVLPIGTPGSILNRGAAYASAFIAALMVCGVVARLIRSLIRATPLRAADRALGAAFGLVRGVLVLLALVLLVGWTPLVKTSAWQASAGATWLQAMLRTLQSALPAAVADVRTPLVFKRAGF